MFIMANTTRLFLASMVAFFLFDPFFDIHMANQTFFAGHAFCRGMALGAVGDALETIVRFGQFSWTNPVFKLRERSERIK